MRGIGWNLGEVGVFNLLSETERPGIEPNRGGPGGEVQLCKRQDENRVQLHVGVVVVLLVRVVRETWGP